jgi:hypothetical protein
MLLETELFDSWMDSSIRNLPLSHSHRAMKKAIQIFALVLSALTLVTGVALGLPAAIALNQITDASVVKGWLAKSMVYDAMIESSLQSTFNTMSMSITDFPNVYSPSLVAAYQQQFPTQAMRGAFESMVDVYYTSMQGQEATLQPSADFATLENFLQNEAIAIFQNYIIALPNCTGDPQTDQTYPQGCIPPGRNREGLLTEMQQVWTEEMADSFSVESFTFDADANKPMQQFFQFSRIFNQIFVAGVVLTSFIFVVANGDRLSGITGACICWTIGAILAVAVTGIFFVLLSWFAQEAEAEVAGDMGIEAFINLTEIALTSILMQVIAVGVLGLGIGWFGSLAAHRLLQKAR